MLYNLSLTTSNDFEPLEITELQKTYNILGVQNPVMGQGTVP